MKKYLILLLPAIVGCASFNTTPVEKLATLHLCYELIAGGQRRSAAIAEELNLRGEHCEKYQEQISLMIYSEAKRSAALKTAIINMSSNFNANSGFYSPHYPQQNYLYQPPPAQVQMPKMVNCNSYKIGNMTNTQCY